MYEETEQIHYERYRAKKEKKMSEYFDSVEGN
jgi:hypothetical protein